MKKVLLAEMGVSAGKAGVIDRRGVDQVPVLPVLRNEISKIFKFWFIFFDVSSCTPAR